MSRYQPDFNISVEDLRSFISDHKVVYASSENKSLTITFTDVGIYSYVVTDRSTKTQYTFSDDVEAVNFFNSFV